MQILCRRTKNNPALLGEAGVGKTAIAEGLGITTDKIIDGIANYDPSWNFLSKRKSSVKNQFQN